MSNIFFHPHIGKQYDKGICGKKVLVIGASFYCDKTDCQHYYDCTSNSKKDSSLYDTICPYYDTELHNAPSEESGKAYDIFADKMQSILNLNEPFWDSVAFTNYIQFFLPDWRTKHRYCSDRDSAALMDVIEKLRPDIIFIWGCVINEHIKTKFADDITIIDNTDGYLWNWIISDKTIKVVNTYHPTYSGFCDGGLIDAYVRKAFLEL